MTLPTAEELGELVYGIMRDASGSIPFATGLNALTELIGISVRDAVLDGLIAEAESRVLLFATWGGSESKNPPPAMALADWLREMKGTP
jgi:hypothetical protein